MAKSLRASRSSAFFLVLVSLVTACSFFSNDAISQPAPSSSPQTVPTPDVKTPSEAERDLKTQIPLDPAKMQPPLPANLFVELGKLINPTVVSISTSTSLRQSQKRYRDPLQEFLEEFYGGRGFGPAPQKRQPLQALGTGFIIRPDGLIITNNHVIAEADVVKIQLDQHSDVFYEAEVIGRDTLTDIALLKIDTKKSLPYARLGSSKDVQVGEWVAAFGNPYGHAHTMTKGIISAIGREIAELNRFPFIQTDASINPGNSGGPLVNAQGYVIGVNTAIDARAQGIGFAIPIDNVKQIVAQLEKNGRVRRGYIGVGIASIDENVAANLGMEVATGVLITQIVRGGPADKAGIQPYDIIIEFGGKKTENASALQNAVAATDIGESAKAKVWRYNESGKRRELMVNVKVAENPDDRRSAKKEPKQYFGQKAPFDLGFKVADYSPALAEEFGIEPGPLQGPLITEVEKKSIAARVGLQQGDMILDVNRQPVRKATDVVKQLKKGRNLMRVLRGSVVIIISIQ